ncbi:MAG: glycosyltransferase family 2 protein [Acidobacteria bacterium]|nr:glycosyltransferase family 2 protein [Acidobacteriota bacterium]
MTVSIVIRCRNEEDWIGHCLSAVFAQDGPVPEVILVDNRSTDKTLAIASRFPVATVVQVDDYSPGHALNRGIEAASGDVVVLLSAHCVPKNRDWLSHLVSGFGDRIAGVYGRQLPVAFSEPSDFRDLVVTFGPEARVQESDSFFHNANSAIRRDVWQQTPFDEDVTNIEDRLWAKQVQAQGFRIAYEPQACVFHHHGIHHTQSRARAESTLAVLKAVEQFEQQAYLPASLLPGQRDIVAVLPIRSAPECVAGRNPLTSLFAELSATPSIRETFVISSDAAVTEAARVAGASILARPPALDTADSGLDDVLQWAMEELGRSGRYPDYVVYANPEYALRPAGLLTTLVEDACYKGLDSVIVAYAEFQNYWRFNAVTAQYEKVGDDLAPRAVKHPMFKSLPGLGTVTRARVIRDGRLVSDHKVGVVQTDDVRATLRTSDPGQRELIRLVLAGEAQS